MIILGTDGHGLKRHGWAARWVKAIFAKGYTQSIDTARSQPCLYFKIKPRISVPKKGRMKNGLRDME